MYNRYNKTRKVVNNTEQYSEVLEAKGVSSLTQYSSFTFNKLRDIADYNLDSIVHTVQPFERLYTISQKYYGSPEYGWLILYTNRIANETLLNIGDPLVIYQPLQTLLELL